MFESFFFKAKEAFILLDKTGTIVDANRSACQFLKRDRQDVAGMPAGYLFQSSVLDELMREADRSDQWTARQVGILEDGLLFVDLKAIKLDPSDGRLLYAFELSKETERLQALTRLKDDLASAQDTVQQERKVSRTLQFTNEKLTSFAHRVAHDVRGPLRIVRMALELYRNPGAMQNDEHREELLDLAERSAGQLEILLVGLLNYSTSTAKDLEREPVKMTEIVTRIAETLNNPGEASWLETGDLPVVNGDRALLEIVFQNLLSNAKKFQAADRPLRVKVSVSGEGDHALIRVRDNGIGFSEDAADKIFALFTQENHGREGAGIGLATCAELIAQHGWSIEGNGAPDEGAEFTISIPWKDVVQLREPKQNSES